MSSSSKCCGSFVPQWRETSWRPKTTLRTPDKLLHKIAGHPRHVCPLQQFCPPSCGPLAPPCRLGRRSHAVSLQPLFPVTPSPPLPFLSLPLSILFSCDQSRSILPRRCRRPGSWCRPSPSKPRASFSPSSRHPPSSPSRIRLFFVLFFPNYGESR
jgi:hypothetical protein